MTVINGIEITDVIIFPIKKVIKDSNVRAFAKVIMNDNFIINGIRVFEGKNGHFINFPKEYKNERDKKGYEVCFPVTSELRYYITEEVLKQYKKVTLV